MQHLQDRLHRRSGLERRTTGEHAIEDCAQRIDVRRRSNVCPHTARLFRRLVTWRAQDLASPREFRVGSKLLRQPKITDLGRPYHIDQFCISRIALRTERRRFGRGWQ